jgi:NADH dehydrogenase
VILVAGGTGRLGSQVVADLLAGGHEVRVLARGKRPPPVEVTGAEVITGSVSDPSVVARAVAGADVVVSAVTGFPFVPPAQVDLAGTRALADAAERAGAELVLISVAGASPDSLMGLFRAKYHAEQALRRSNTEWTIIRPEAFADLWIDLLTTSAGRSHRPLVFGRGNNPFGWVAVRDVSALTVRAVQTRSLRQTTLTISGPQRLTLTELACRVMAVHGWPGTPRQVPTGALRLASMLPGRAGRQAEAALAMDVMLPVVDDARQAVPHLPITPVEALLAPDRAGHS